MIWTMDPDPAREPFGAGALPDQRYKLIPAAEIIERPGQVRVALTPRVAAILRANRIPFRVGYEVQEESEPPPVEPPPPPVVQLEDATGRTRRERRRR